MTDLTDPQTPLATRLGRGGLYLSTACARLVPSLAYLGLALQYLAFAIGLGVIWPRIRHDTLVRVIAAFAAYMLVLTAWAAWRFPDTAAMQARQGLALVEVWLFVVAAWWLGGSERRVVLVLGLAMAGFIAKTALQFDTGVLEAISGGYRTGFGMSAIPFGLYGVTAILGLLLLAPRFIGDLKHKGWFALRSLLWIGCLLLLAQGVIAAQSRATWLAALIVAPPLLLWRLHVARVAGSLSGPRLVALVAVVVIGLGGVLAANLDTVRQRLGGESATARSIVELDVENIPSNRESSMGVRFHLYHMAVNRWLERPLFGWGPATSRVLIEDQERKELRVWQHLHSTYLEILVRLGLVGAAFYVVGAWLVLRAVFAARRRGQLAPDLFLLLLGVFGMSAIWSLTDFRMIHADWHFYWLLFGGIAYTFALHPEGDEGRGTRD